MTAYLRPRLLDPLGIGDVGWLEYPAGRAIGFSGLHATTDAVARLGQLYLQGGVWEGERLLPASWVAEATRCHIANSSGTPEAATSDWQQGYGFQFWQSRHGYRGDGAYGQFCVVLPEYDAVIAMTAQTELMQDQVNLMWDHLLPAFGSAPLPGRDKADTALRERLARLALPTPAAGPGTPADPDAWSGVSFAPEGGGCAAQPTLTAATLTAAGTGWTLTLTDSDTPLDLAFGGSGWTVADTPVPAAVTATWPDPATFTADIAFLETPHRLTVSCSLPEGTFTARWHTAPLHPGPLHQYRSPER